MSLSFTARVALAWKLLFDAGLAARVEAVTRTPVLPSADPERSERSEPDESAEGVTPALQLLALLQREGRLVDFLKQDVASFSDADIGAAARLVHEGCKKALRACAAIEPVRTEAEGSIVMIVDGFDPSAVKLTGNVTGAPPFRGVLRHKGWRAERLVLPVIVGERDVAILAPAEVEL